MGRELPVVKLGIFCATRLSKPGKLAAGEIRFRQLILRHCMEKHGGCEGSRCRLNLGGRVGFNEYACIRTKLVIEYGLLKRGIDTWRMMPACTFDEQARSPPTKLCWKTGGSERKLHGHIIEAREHNIYDNKAGKGRHARHTAVVPNLLLLLLQDRGCDGMRCLICDSGIQVIHKPHGQEAGARRAQGSDLRV